MKYKSNILTSALISALAISAMTAAANANSEASGITLAEAESICSNGFTVPDQDINLGLARDCVALLISKHELTNGADHRLNWGGRTVIANWDGVEIEATETGDADVVRVTTLSLNKNYPQFFDETLRGKSRCQ